MLIWSRAKAAVRAEMINAWYLLRKTANPALIFLLRNRKQLPQLKKKITNNFSRVSHYKRKRFLCHIKHSAKLTTREHCAGKMLLLCAHVSAVRGRARKQTPVMICTYDRYPSSPDTSEVLKLQRSRSVGLASVLFPIALAVEHFSLRAIFSCYPAFLTHPSPASVTEAAGSCHCGDLI